MARHDIVAIGGSAGGLDALREVVRGLPGGLPLSVFIVMHIPPYAVSRLPEILGRDAALPVSHAAHGEPVMPGHVYVAPPDYHLLVRDGRIELSHGPRENHSRPAIDPLFRSVARAYGSQAIGVILSGTLYDGSAGLATVKARGGVAIVQDPVDASFDSIPRHALDLVEADFVLPAKRIGMEIGRLAREEVRDERSDLMIDDDDRLSRVIERDFGEQAGDERANDLTMYTCPDCGGALWQAESGPHGRFRCHVGHAYTPEVLLGQKSEELEAALWSCVRLLREKATLTRQTAVRSRAGGQHGLATRGEESAQLSEDQARVIRELLEAMPSLANQVPAQPAAIGVSEPAASG